MSFSLVEMWHSMGLPAKIVGAFLLTMGLASLTVFIERLLALRRSRTSSREFARTLGEGIQEGDVATVIKEAAKYPRGHLARLVQSALTPQYDDLRRRKSSNTCPGSQKYGAAGSNVGLPPSTG